MSERVLHELEQKNIELLCEKYKQIGASEEVLNYVKKYMQLHLDAELTSKEFMTEMALQVIHNEEKSYGDILSQNPLKRVFNIATLCEYNSLKELYEKYKNGIQDGMLLFLKFMWFDIMIEYFCNMMNDVIKNDTGFIHLDDITNLERYHVQDDNKDEYIKRLDSMFMYYDLLWLYANKAIEYDDTKLLNTVEFWLDIIRIYAYNAFKDAATLELEDII